MVISQAMSARKYILGKYENNLYYLRRAEDGILQEKGNREGRK